MKGSKTEVVAYYVAQVKGDATDVIRPALNALSGVAKDCQDETIKAELAPLFFAAIPSVKDSKWMLVSMANGLKFCGKHAKSALPQLKELQTHADKDVAAAADQAVQAIEKALEQ